MRVRGSLVLLCFLRHPQTSLHVEKTKDALTAMVREQGAERRTQCVVVSSPPLMSSTYLEATDGCS